MNLTDPRYSEFALVQEMMQTIDVIQNFDPGRTKAVAEKIKSAGRLFFTGEGSSRILPAKNAIRKALTWGMNMSLFTEGSRQSMQYDLSKLPSSVLPIQEGPKEVVLLAKKLAAMGNENRFALTANKDTLLENECYANLCSQLWLGTGCGCHKKCHRTSPVL